MRVLTDSTRRSEAGLAFSVVPNWGKRARSLSQAWTSDGMWLSGEGGLTFSKTAQFRWEWLPERTSSYRLKGQDLQLLGK